MRSAAIASCRPVFLQLLRQVILGLGLVGVLGLGACTKGEAELQRDDRAKIDLIVAEDVRASHAMAEADAASRRGDLPAALQAIEGRARPAIQDGLRLARATETRTAWGSAKRGTFREILAARDAELAAYTAALKSDDPATLIAAIEAQAAIERRAVLAVDEVTSGR